MFAKQLHPNELAGFPLHLVIISLIYLLVRSLGIYKVQEEEKRYAYFFLLWALKESYVKAIGCGISGNLANISFVVDGDAVDCCRYENYMH